MNTPTFYDWKAAQLLTYLGEGTAPTFTWGDYKSAHPEAKEYICVHLSPEHKLFHLPQEPMLATDNLAEACVFVHDHFKLTGEEVGVYQERSAGYREIYQHKSYHDKRAKNGKFAKA